LDGCREGDITRSGCKAAAENARQEREQICVQRARSEDESGEDRWKLGRL